MVKLVASSAFNVKSLTVPNSSSYSLFDLTTAQTLSVNGFVMGGPFDSTLATRKSPRWGLPMRTLTYLSPSPNSAA